MCALCAHRSYTETGKPAVLNGKHCDWESAAVEQNVVCTCSKLSDFEPFDINVNKNQSKFLKNENTIGIGIDKIDKGMD